MDNTVKETFTLTLTYEMSVNTDTGEVLEIKLLDRSVNKPKVVRKKLVEEDTDEEPKLYLEENKYRLSEAAVSLMKLESDDKLDIKYENGIPVIGTDNVFGTKGGNKLTKSNTVAYRGNKNEELAKHGSEFTLVPHPSKPGLFILSSGLEVIDPSGGDDNVRADQDEDTDLPFDLKVDDLAEIGDADVTEIDASFFKL